MKVDFNRQQRMELTNIFVSKFKDNPIYKQLGSTTKTLYQEQIKFHFIPLDLPDSKLPPYPVDQERYDKDDEGNIIRTFYIIKIQLNFPYVANGVEKIELVAEISKELLNVAA